jgi:hypothetical protein
MGATGGDGIFVNYRPAGEQDFAGRLPALLADRFGDDQVFIDVGVIGPGVDFAEVISRAAATCKVLAIIGPNWLTAADKRAGGGSMTQTTSHGWKSRPRLPAMCGQQETSRLLQSLLHRHDGLRITNAGEVASGTTD